MLRLVETRGIVRLYRLRGRIEEVLRAPKSGGIRLDKTQVHHARRLFKLAIHGRTGGGVPNHPTGGRPRRQRKTDDRRDRSHPAAPNAVFGAASGNRDMTGIHDNGFGQGAVRP